MVSVELKRDRQGRKVGFVCSGHAAFSKNGSDIVCAGISSLTHTTILTLDRLLNIPLRLRSNAAEGYLECDWSNQPEMQDKIQLIIESMQLGLMEIQKQYPDHLIVREVEVQSDDSV